MGGVILQLPRQQAPNSPLAIDWSNPLTVGLRRAWFASTGLDHVSGACATNNSPSNNVPGQNQYGQTLRCDGAQAAQSYTLPNIAGMSKEFTILTVSTTLSGAERPLAGVWGSSGNRQFYLAINSSRLPLIAATDGAVNRIYTATSAAVSASARTAVAGGWKASGDVCRLWVNGFPVAGTKAGTAVSSLPSTSLPVSIAAQSTGGSAALSGDIELVLIFNRLLSDAEIRALTINPYQILRTRRNYLTGAITGLSSVSNDVVLTYNTLSAAQSYNSISWNVVNSISKDGSILWNLQNSVSSDNSISWDLISQVISDKGLSWDTLSSAVKDGVLSWDSISSVTSNTDVSWNVVSSVFVDKSINYDVLANVTSNQSTSWNIAQFVFADKSIEWDISSTMLTAFADIALRYDIVSSVYQDFNTYWDLLQQVGGNQQIDFDILTSVLSDKAITWGIAEAVANDLTIVANLLQNTGQDLSITWDSAGIVSGDLIIKYNISTDAVILPPIERILKISLQDRTLKVLQQSLQDRTLKVVQQSRILSIQ